MSKESRRIEQRVASRALKHVREEALPKALTGLAQHLATTVPPEELAKDDKHHAETIDAYFESYARANPADAVSPPQTSEAMQKKHGVSWK